ncbi:MAG: AMP-binding protein, partial [Pseudomonadota bacterium]
MLSVIQGKPPAPCPEPFNMAAYVLGTGDPGKVALMALRDGDQVDSYTYGALRNQVAGLAAGLLDLGLSPGERILMRLGNQVAFPLTYLASLWAGLVPVPTAAGLTVPEITAIADDLSPALTITAEGLAVPVGHRSMSFDQIPCLEPVSPDLGAPDRLAYIIFTSGTSGKSRGVLHAHRAVWARRMMWTGWVDLTSNDVVMHAGAFNWTYTLGIGLMDPWACGATAVIPPDGTRPAALPALARRYGATILAAVPGVYRQMVRDADDMHVPSLRHALSAGEKLPENVRRSFASATGCDVHEALGMSECSTFISGSPARPAPGGSLGWPQPGRHVAVLGDNGEPLPRGAPGTLAVHQSDPGLMLGYLNAPEETAAKLQGPWFKTGDT